MSGYRVINTKIVKAADKNLKNPGAFLVFLEKLCKHKQELDFVNVATLLHRSARLGLSLPAHIISFVIVVSNFFKEFVSVSNNSNISINFLRIISIRASFVDFLMWLHWQNFACCV